MLPSFIHVLPTGPVGSSNCIYIDDEIKCLVDSGIPESYDVIRARLGERPIDIIINTHSHPDHIGNNARFFRQAGVKEIALHSQGMSILSHRERRHWYRSFLPVDYDFPVTRTLQEGDLINLGRCRLQVISTPGHSPDGICLYEEHYRFLISGDTVLKEDTGTITARREWQQGIDCMENSIKRLQELDIQTILPGHGSIITDPQSNFRIILKKLAKFRRNPLHIMKHIIDKCLLPVCYYTRKVHRDVLMNHYCNSDWYQALRHNHPEDSLKDCLLQTLDALVYCGILEQDGSCYLYPDTEAS